MGATETTGNLTDQSALSLAARIRAREVSPVEVLEAFADRIDERNPELNAFAFLALDEARDRARAAEAQLADDELLPPLFGVPTALKDLFDAKPGWPMTFGGVPALRENISDFSCAWGERIEAAGAIVVGKTNSPAFGFRGVTDNGLFGPTRNPFDLARNAGGSSGGAAAAVAGGLLPFAEGSDAGGSVRIPSSWCGTFAHKPTSGITPLVIRPNAFLGNAPYPAEAAITRTVADAAAILDVQVGPDRRDPQTSARPAGSFSDLMTGGVVGVKVGVSVDLGTYPVSRDVAARILDCVRVLEDAGAIVELVDVDLGVDHAQLTQLWQRTISPLSLAALEHMRALGLDLRADPEELPQELRHWLDVSEGLTMKEQIEDSVARTRIFDGVEAVFDRFDLLVSATTATTACLNSTSPGGLTLGPSSVEGREVEPTIGWALTPAFNLTGHPAASVPAGLIEGLPVGMQIVGRRFDDGRVLAAAKVVEDSRPWIGSYSAL